MTTPLVPNPFTLGSFSKEKHAYMMEFDVENWYAAIQPYTFETHFVPLTVDEARAMAKSYKATKIDTRLQLTESEASMLEGATRKIDEHIDKLKSKGRSSFVRISSRSPKDAGLDGNAHLKQLVNEEIAVFKQRNIPIDANIKLQALFNGSARLLEVTSGEQAMGLLVNSERIYSDLIHALDQDLELWNMKFIIREFVKLDVSYEFRGFVCKKMLTALSQYNDLCYYPQLKGRELEIVDKIFDFFNVSLRDLIDYEAYVIDFVLINNDIIKVIEINPFGPMTGASLFNWQEDRYILQGGVDLYGDLPNEITLPADAIKGAREPPVAEFTTTRLYEVGWKTLFRVYSRVPEAINTEYINIVYGDILKTKAEGLQKIFKVENANNCIII